MFYEKEQFFQVKPDLIRPINDYMFSPIIQLAQPDQFTILTSLLANAIKIICRCQESSSVQKKQLKQLVGL